MGGLKIPAAVFRGEAVRNLSEPPQGVCVSRRGPACIGVQPCEFAKDVTQLPTEFSRTRLLRLAKRVEEKIAVFPIINPVCHDDLCRNDGATKIDNQSMGVVGPEREARQLPQAESRILLSEKEVLHFDLDPR